VDRDRVKAFLAPVRPKSVQTQTVAGKAYALVTLRACDQQRVLKRDGEEYAGEKLGIHAPPTDHHHVAACTSSGKVAKGNVKADAARILDTGRLFARSLPPTVTEEALREVFAQFGDIADVKLPRARDGKLKGFAVITFMFPEHALQAYTQLDGQIFQVGNMHANSRIYILCSQGRNLFLVPGEEAREEHVDAPIVDGAPSTFKKEKGKKQKNTAVSGHNWNALFLGTNAVADSMALQLNTDKSALLDAEAHASLAVRMALGETNMVRNTRTFLMKHGEWEQCLADVYVRAGVQLDAFGQTNGVRSRNVILVKNLPMNTDVDALRTTFSQHGQVGRVLLPPGQLLVLYQKSKR
jgi:multiple RNA-binding domain-containing protein 1